MKTMFKMCVLSMVLLWWLPNVYARLEFMPSSGLPIYSSDNTTDCLVITTNTIYSHSFYLNQGEYYSVSIKCETDNDADIKVQLEQSFRRPVTEGDNDTYWAIPVSMPDIDSGITVETIRHYFINPIALPFGRFKLSGNDGNNDSTTVKIWLNKMENR